MDTAPGADAEIMTVRTASAALWSAIGGAAVCAALGLWAFGGDRRVPLLGWIDLALHEAGHVLAAPLPTVPMLMAGSVAQVLVPLLIVLHFLRRREHVSAMMCLAWAGTSARDVSVYIADAPYERLDLIGGRHDWAGILGPEGFGALDQAAAIASAVHGLGLAMVVGAVAGCLARPLLAERRSAPAPDTAVRLRPWR